MSNINAIAMIRHLQANKIDFRLADAPQLSVGKKIGGKSR